MQIQVMGRNVQGSVRARQPVELLIAHILGNNLSPKFDIKGVDLVIPQKLITVKVRYRNDPKFSER